MTTEIILNTAISSVDHCVAIGYVDISTGLLLGVQTVNSHPSEVLNLVALATVDLFNGSNIIQIEDKFKKARGVNTSRHYFQEVLVNSDNLVHYFLRDKDNQNHVAVFVCKNTVMLGMGLKQARKAMILLAKHFAQSALHL